MNQPIIFRELFYAISLFDAVYILIGVFHTLSFYLLHYLLDFRHSINAYHIARKILIYRGLAVAFQLSQKRVMGIFHCEKSVIAFKSNRLCFPCSICLNAKATIR